MSNQRYMMRGVSASKEDVHNAIKNIDKGIFPRAFCKIIPDILGGDPEYCNIMHADGAGTKSSLAYLYWKETGDLSVWKGIAQDALIMNIDRSHIGHHQRHGRAAGRTARDGRGRLCHGRRNGRRGRPGAHHHRRQHRDLPHEAQRCHRQCQHPSGRRHRGPRQLRTGYLREGIQRRHGQQRTHLRPPRRLCQIPGREISGELRPRRAPGTGI